MQLQLVPALLGWGRQPFEDLPPDHIELGLLRALPGPGVPHLRYRCARRAEVRPPGPADHAEHVCDGWSLLPKQVSDSPGCSLVAR